MLVRSVEVCVLTGFLQVAEVAGLQPAEWDVVVPGTKKLCPEKRREAALSEEIELARLMHHLPLRLTATR